MLFRNISRILMPLFYFRPSKLQKSSLAKYGFDKIAKLSTPEIKYIRIRQFESGDFQKPKMTILKLLLQNRSFTLRFTEELSLRLCICDKSVNEIIFLVFLSYFESRPLPSFYLNNLKHAVSKRVFSKVAPQKPF